MRKRNRVARPKLAQAIHLPGLLGASSPAARLQKVKIIMTYNEKDWERMGEEVERLVFDMGKLVSRLNDVAESIPAVVEECRHTQGMLVSLQYVLAHLHLFVVAVLTPPEEQGTSVTNKLSPLH